jgi:starch phosphorylase
MNAQDVLLRRAHIAYFSMEIALRAEIHTYAGGLGVLAGDTARTCADLELPVVFVSLISRSGYLLQVVDERGRQLDLEDPWQPEAWCEPLSAKIAVGIGGRDVWVRPWLHTVAGGSGFAVPVLLLDTDLDENAPEDRGLTRRLYAGDARVRLAQEIVLGIGGLRLLRALGCEIHTYHLNEGHAALLCLELLRQQYRPSDQALPDECSDDLRRVCAGCIHDVLWVRDRCVFTTHTPVEAGHDRFPYDLVRDLLNDTVSQRELQLIGGTDALNMTRVALTLSGYVNGVAERHAETSRKLFPGFRIRAITNGVHPGTWASDSMARLYESRFPQWRHEPEILVRADRLDDDELWQAHRESKGALLRLIRERTGLSLREDVLLVGFARRMTGYKRPALLLSDPARLAAIHRSRPLQIVLAGKAHPQDRSGLDALELIHARIRELAGIVPVAFLAGHDLALARALAAGADLWLNTPAPPLEASGTSGMKAALNGVLNLSVPDGWWQEALIEGVTGWAIGDGEAAADDRDAGVLYDKLERQILPLYYDDRKQWLWMMKQSISKIAYYFNSHRMMRRYATEAYLR